MFLSLFFDNVFEQFQKKTNTEETVICPFLKCAGAPVFLFCFKSKIVFACLLSAKTKRNKNEMKAKPTNRNDHQNGTNAMRERNSSIRWKSANRRENKITEK